MEEGHKADSNNTLHSEEPPLFFFKAFFCGQKVGLWLCWVTNYIFFSENLCKVGSFVLTLILFVWHLCPFLTRAFLYKWVVFKGKILTEVWREFKDKKKHGYYTSPCSVWKKVHGWTYVLVQDILKTQVCAVKHASTSYSLYSNR